MTCCLIPRQLLGCAKKAPGPAAAGTMRTFEGLVFKHREHLQSLYSSLEGGHVDPGITLDEMVDATLSVIEANLESRQPGDEFVVGQVVSTGPSLSSDAPVVDVLIYCQVLDFSDFARS